MSGSTTNGENEGTTPVETLAPRESYRDALAAHMARNVCEGFIRHDDRDWRGTVAAFFEVDRFQFAHLTEAEAREAATAYAAALWAKDEVEEPYVSEDGLDREGLDAADWGPVVTCLERRADLAGMDREYATATAEGWRKHKTGGDYWTPHMCAQTHEVRAAVDDPAYPRKTGSGFSGFGPLAARYLVGVELHDVKSEFHWRRAVEEMTAYYEELLRLQCEATTP